MSELNQVSTQILLPIVEKLRLEGVRAAPLLSQVGIDRDRLEDVNHYVPLSAYIRFFELAASELSNPYFGLDCGRMMDSGSLGAISFLFMSAPTLRDGFRGLTEYLSALQTGTDGGLLIDQEEARFHYRLSDERIAPRRQDAEYSMSVTFHLIKRYLNRPFNPIEVHFEHQQIGNHHTYANFFGCDVFFGQATNAIAFDVTLLDISAPSFNYKLYPIIAANLQERIEKHKPGKSVSEQVRSFIDTNALSQGTSAADIAEKLGISESTLSRRLRAEGSSFGKVLADKRMNIAKRLLAHTDQSIAEIALSLGYAENASFTRAFKTWCDVTPDRFRAASKKSV